MPSWPTWRVFAAAGPLGRNAERVHTLCATRLRSTTCRPSSSATLRAFCRRCAGRGRRRWECARRSASIKRAADGLIRDRVRRQIELQQAHRAFDIHADRAGINVRRRDQHAADRRAVAAVRVGIEHQIGDARRAPRIDRLLEAHFVERAADRFRADDGDGLCVAAGGRIRWLRRWEMRLCIDFFSGWLQNAYRQRQEWMKRSLYQTELRPQGWFHQSLTFPSSVEPVGFEPTTM